MTRTQLLVIIPTYNERENLLPLVNSVQDALSTADILIVDDNSPDGTGDIATERASRDTKVHVLHRSKKNGLGRAYIAGFRWALQHHYSHIFQIDAPLKRRIIKYLFDKLDGYAEVDVVEQAQAVLH